MGDPNDIHALARAFAFELRQLIKTDRDGERRRISSAAVNDFDKAGDGSEPLQVFVDGTGLEAIQAYCLLFMCFPLGPSGDYGCWPDLEGLEYAVRSKDGVASTELTGATWVRVIEAVHV